MKTIIVPVDFSENSANATEFAANLAAFYGASLLLYHAYQLPVVMHEFAYPAFDIQETQRAAEHELEVMMENTLSKIKVKIAIEVKAEMVTLHEGLAELCNNLKPDLIVMALSGKNALTRLIIGSNTIKAIQELKYPILVIPSKAEFIPIRKIGFACDYQNIKQTTPVDLLKKMVNDFRADLHVLNVNNFNQGPGSEMMNESLTINDLLKDIKVQYNTIQAGDVTDGINWFAEKEKLDWIAVIPKKHPLLQKMFSQSHTKHLLYHTQIPILCIHE
jgi:nucleotide-binding universal stress UspA family protein